MSAYFECFIADDLVKLLESDAFTGSYAILEKYSSFVISLVKIIVSISGLLMYAFQVIVTAASFLYVSFPRLFDTIDEIKQQKQAGGGQFYGQGNFVMFIAATLIPNVKELSDFNSRTGYNYITQDGRPTIATYVRENAVRFFVIAFLGAIIFGGQYTKIIANFTRGGVVIAEAFGSVDIENKMRKIVEADKDYEFVFVNTTEGKMKKRIAQKIYSTVKDNYNIRTAEFNDALGSKIYTALSSGSLSNITLKNSNAYGNQTLSIRVKYLETALSDAAIQEGNKAGNSGTSLLKQLRMSDLVDASFNPKGVIVIQYSVSDVFTQLSSQNNNNNTNTTTH
jgi:hypothetical protein